MACFTDDLGPVAYYTVARVGGQSSRSIMMDAIRSVGGLLTSVPVPTCISSRTGLEKSLLGLGGAYALVQGYRFGMFGQLGRVICVVVPGAGWLKARFGSRLETVMETQRTTVKTNLESRRDGSVETPMTTPRYQCKIGFKRLDKFVVIGCAVRFHNNVLVGPDHILSDEELEEKFAYGSQSMVSLKGKERIVLDTDLVGISLTAKEFSTIGLAELTIADVPDNGVMAQVVGPEGRGTLGLASHDTASFGRITYTGTTIGGYSGAAYFTGAGAIGIHQMGGNVNSGYATGYIWLLIKQKFNLRNESSEDWLLGQFKAGKKLKWSYCGDPEFVNVMTGGKFNTVQISSMNTAFGTDWQNDPVIEKGNMVRDYGDFEGAVVRPTSVLEALSGNGPSSILPGVSSTQAQNQDQVLDTVQQLTAMYSGLSKNQRRTVQKLLGLQSKQTQASAGLR